VHITGFVNDTAPYYTAFDLLVFPSHREGLPNVPLEAAAAGRPTAGFAATGTVDAVRNGETGTLVAVGDVAGLTDAVRRYLSDQVLLARHGQKAVQCVRTDFRREVIWQELADLYRKELRAHGLPIPEQVLRRVA
jgi:glycosyltransferase involved in cell wall biosynthesis